MEFPGLVPVEREEEARKPRQPSQGDPVPRDPSTLGADVPVVDAQGNVEPAERFPGLVPVETPTSRTFGERAEAFGGGIRRGVQAAAPLVAGLAAGAAAAPTGPVGIGIAGTTAFEATRQATKSMAANVPEVSELPPELRPFSVAGEVIGAGGPVGVGPTAVQGALGQIGRRAGPVIEEAGGSLFQRTMQFIKRQGREVGRTARESPGTQLTAEGSALASAAAGGGAAESLDPGDSTTRFLSEAAAGLASPASLIISGADGARNAATQALTSRGRAGLERQAAQELGRVTSDLGEDSRQLAGSIRREIRNTGTASDPRTVGQMVDSPSMQALENTLVQRSSEFGKEAKDAAREAMDSYRSSIARLESSGDPQLIRKAASLRKEYFDDLLQGIAANAERRVVEVGQRMAPGDSVPDPSTLSSRADAIVSDALSKAREAEGELWSKFDGSAVVEAPNTLARIAQVRTDMIEGESLPPIVSGFARELRQGGISGDTRIVTPSGRPAAEAGGETGRAKLKRLQRFRSQMLDSAREADKNFQAGDARLFGSIAEAALDDMLAIDSPELNDARAFSRSLNDVFTRTFAGQTASTGRGGASRLPPEILLRRASSGGRELAGLRMQELSRAVEFGDPEAAEELLSMQESFLRHAAQETIDPDTGVVSAGRLRTFKRNNSALLERFPQLEKDIKDLSTARQALDETVASGKQTEKIIRQRAAFSEAAKAENATAFVGKVLGGERPQENMRQLVALAKRSGPDAVAGLRRAVFDDAFAKAGGETESFSFTRFDRLLNQPRRPGQPSTMQMLQRADVLDQEQVGRMRKLLGNAERVERALSTQGSLDELLEGENAVTDLVLRVVGAGAGAQASSITGGGAQSLVAAGAGSRFMRQVFDKVPRGRVQDVLIEAAQNPPLMASLLEKAPTPSEKIALARRIHGYLFAAGLTESPAEGAPEQEGSVEQ